MSLERLRNPAGRTCSISPCPAMIRTMCSAPLKRYPGQSYFSLQPLSPSNIWHRSLFQPLTLRTAISFLKSSSPSTPIALLTTSLLEQPGWSAPPSRSAPGVPDSITRHTTPAAPEPSSFSNRKFGCRVSKHARVSATTYSIISCLVRPRREWKGVDIRVSLLRAQI